MNINLPIVEEEILPICSEGFAIRYDCTFEQYNLCEADKEKCECCIKEIDCPYFNKATTEILPSEPLPYIGSMTDTGLFEIRWDKEMQDLGNLATIKQSAV
jgi:hypothetical protein